MLVADFFKIKEIDRDFLSKSGHNMEAFLACAEKNGFQLITKKDITPHIIGTLKKMVFS